MNCATCGQPVDPNDKFCKNCGTLITAQATIPAPVYVTSAPDPVLAKKGFSPNAKYLPFLIFVAIVAAAVIGWMQFSNGTTSGLLNRSYPPPSYIKDVVSYKEGSDGFVVYFILADSVGGMTRATGRAKLTVTSAIGKQVAYDKVAYVTASDFLDTKAGVGAYEHDVVIASFGRITYSALNPKPSPVYDTYNIDIEFKTADGKVLTGNDTIYLTK